MTTFFTDTALEQGSPIDSAATKSLDTQNRAPSSFRRGELLRTGITDSSIQSAIRNGRAVALRPGFYVESTAFDALLPEQRHRVLIGHYEPKLDEGCAISHTSAAVMWGLPLWSVALGRVHITRAVRHGAHRNAGVHVHGERNVLDSRVIDGVRVTSAPRTVVDLARFLPFEQAVVAADAALHRGIVTAQDLEVELDKARGRRGISKARSVVAFADGRSESVGESRSRVRLAQAGMTGLVLQHDICDQSGDVIGRADFAIPELTIAGEFDGRVKYGRLLASGETPGDAVFREKRREDAMRDLGWRVIRWVWDELTTFHIVVQRWERAIAAARAIS